VPVGVLPALDSMHIKDGINFMFLTEIDNLFEPGKPFFLINIGVLIILKMAVIQSQADTGGPGGFNELNIFLCQKIGEHFLEEESAQILSQTLFYLFPEGDFRAGISIYKVLHIHPAPYTGAPEIKWTV